jgi:glycosyltransferase involved in cell wall biosynthesis
VRLTADLRMFRHSGIGRYLRNVMPHLLPLLAADRVRVLGPHGIFADAAWRNDPRIEVFTTPAPIYSVQEQMLGMRGAYRNTRLLWVPHYNAPLWHSGRMIVTFHDIGPMALPEILSNMVKRGYAKLLIERAAKQAAAILCVSQFTRSELSGMGVAAEKMTVTPLGLDSGWPSSAPPHREQDGVPYLLFVGNVKPNKNLDLLLRAFAALQDRIPFRLLLAGRMRGFGTDDEVVLRKATAMGDRVRFVGEIDDATLQSLYAGATALVLPSLYEGFGLPLLEAMQLGCPVLASTAGALPEVGGDAALYFDPRSESQLAQCLLQSCDSSAMSELSRRGRERVTHFSFARCAQQMAAVMNRLMEHPQ